MDTTDHAALMAGRERLVYSVAEVRDLLGISRAFAYELVARGELPVIRLGSPACRPQGHPQRPGWPRAHGPGDERRT